MSFEPDARLVLSEDVDLRSLPLTPADFFIFSRIQALQSTKPSIADIVAASGQTEEVARAVIEKLIELGVVAVDRSAASSGPGRQRTKSGRQLALNDDVRARALSRKRELLEAQMRAMRERAAARKGISLDASEERGGQGEREQEPAEAPLPVSRPVLPSAARARRSILEEVEPVAASDPRLITGSKVELERQRRLLGLRDSLRHVGHFELLGLDPTDDVKVIRRAYHVVSRDFHPDTFYGEELGAFAQVLDELFRRARASYDFLLDAERRKPLIDAHQAKLAAEQSAVDRIREQQARQAEVEAAEKERVARDARAARDRERQARIMSRALSTRRKRADKHAEQARRELAAGRHGTAATLFRLAFEQDPSNTEHERAWRQSLHAARQERGSKAFAEGQRAAENFRAEDAARCFATAADADPTLRHLAAAAGANAEIEIRLALKYAKLALEVLADSRAQRIPLEDEFVAHVHESCARAYLAAGELSEAHAQARLAHDIAPTDDRRALLKQSKVT